MEPGAITALRLSQRAVLSGVKELTVSVHRHRASAPDGGLDGAFAMMGAILLLSIERAIATIARILPVADEHMLRTMTDDAIDFWRAGLHVRSWRYVVSGRYDERAEYHVERAARRTQEQDRSSEHRTKARSTVTRS